LGSKPASFQEMLSSGAVQLVHKVWLERSFVQDGTPLVRRQELPAEARVCPADAAESLKGYGTVAVLSHAWLAPGHPDPRGVRREELKLPDHVQYIFWDFLSLHQVARSAREELLFQFALRGMHLVYSHPRVRVIRLVHVPANSASPRPYEERGWCCFETAVASLRESAWRVAQGGTCWKTSVPLRPCDFDRELLGKHFTSKKADASAVRELYKHMWTTTAPTLKKFDAWHWSLRELNMFVQLLPNMPSFESVGLTFFEETFERRHHALQRLAEKHKIVICVFSGFALCDVYCRSAQLLIARAEAAGYENVKEYIVDIRSATT